MANPNKQPSPTGARPERVPTVNERHLDNERILHEEPTVARLKTPADLQLYETYTKEIVSAGQIYDATGTVVDRIDPSILRKTYWELCRDTLNAPNAQKTGKDIIKDPSNPSASYASVIVANNPHPETFLNLMHQRFTADNPGASDVEKADFAKGLDQMAMLIYGARYIEYNEQRNDLNLLGVEEDKNSHDMHNREIDADILGKSFRVRRMVHGIALNIRNEHVSRVAKLKNVASSPKAAWLRGRATAATHKLKRKQVKIGHKQLKIDNAQARLDASTNPFFQQMRQNRIDRRQDKLDARHQKFQDKVAYRETLRDNHRSMMRNRSDSARDMIKANHEIHQSRIDQYTSLRETALANRELRRELKGASHQERQRRLQEFREKATPEQIHRLARSAQIERCAKQRLDTLHARHDRARTKADMQRAMAMEYDDKLHANNDALTDIRDRFTLANQTIATLEQSVSDIATQLTTLDPTDRGYDLLTARQQKDAAQLLRLKREVVTMQAAITKLESVSQQLEARRDKAQQLSDEQYQIITDLDPHIIAAADEVDERDGTFKRTLDKTTFN